MRPPPAPPRPPQSPQPPPDPNATPSHLRVEPLPADAIKTPPRYDGVGGRRRGRGDQQLQRHTGTKPEIVTRVCALTKAVGRKKAQKLRDLAVFYSRIKIDVYIILGIVGG